MDFHFNWKYEMLCCYILIDNMMHVNVKALECQDEAGFTLLFLFIYRKERYNPPAFSSP